MYDGEFINTFLENVRVPGDSDRHICHGWLRVSTKSNITTIIINWSNDRAGPIFRWRARFDGEQASIFKKTIPLIASVLLLAGSPALAASHHARIKTRTDDWLSARAYLNDGPIRSTVCASPPIIDKYAQSTATPPGCPGDTGPYR